MIYAAIVFLPLAGALIAGLFGRAIGDRPSEVITTALLFIAAALSWVAFVQTGFEHETHKVQLMRWITSGELDTSWSLRIDALTGVMLVVVTTVSALVHLYSIGYMHEDDSRPRFFAYLSLFTFAMLTLVTSDNLLQMFFGWEGVGLCVLSADRLLVQEARGQRRRDQGVRRQPRRRLRLRARHLRAVLRVRVDQPRRASSRRRRAAVGKTFIDSPAIEVDMLTTIALLLFIGAMGKSRAVPAAHVAARRDGRPDAGLRADPCRDHGDGRRVHGRARCRRSSSWRRMRSQIVTLVGAVTAFFAATVGLVQNDIKRVIAYSTCSQLGYMFVACGVGAYGAGDLPPLHARVLQGAAVPRRRLRHPRHASRAGHAAHGRAASEYPVDVLGDVLIGTLSLTGVGMPHARRFRRTSIRRTPSSRPPTPRTRRTIMRSGCSLSRR